MAIFRKCSANFQDCITWRLNTISEYPKRLYLKNGLFFFIFRTFFTLMLINVIFSYFLMMTWSWHYDDKMMTQYWNQRQKNLHFILFLLLKIIIWPVLNVIACSKLILLHFLFFKNFTRKLGFFKSGFLSCSCNWRSRVTTALNFLKVM